MLEFLHIIVGIKEVEHFVYLFENHLIGSKQCIISIDFSCTFVEVTRTDKTIAFQFFTFFAFNYAYFTMYFESTYAKNEFYTFCF